MLYHGGRAVMYPHKQGQYSNHPPYTLGHSGWSLKFHDLVLGLGKGGTELNELRRSPLLPRIPKRRDASRRIHRLDEWARVGSLLPGGANGKHLGRRGEGPVTA